MVILANFDWLKTVNNIKPACTMKRRHENTSGTTISQSSFSKRIRVDDIRGIKVFNVYPLEKYNLKFPSFRQPKEFGSFSVDIDRVFHCDKSQLKHYIEPPNPNDVNFDLRKGYRDMIRKDEEIKEYINPILQWIDCSKEKFRLNTESTLQGIKTKSLHTDFICWRGLLTKFLCTPYENREGWLVGVTLFNGSYYMYEFETDEKREQRRNTTERQDEMCCWGWKFEQYLMADDKDGQPNTDVPFNNKEAFCTVVRSRLNSHSLVFSGEVDGLDKSGKYIELKTSRDFSTHRQEENFKRYKLIKWWAQSFLVGIPQIITGFRDDDGVVHRLQTYDTLKIPELVKGIYNAWNPAICFNFLDKLLGFIKESVTCDNHKVVYLLRWNPRGDVVCEKLQPNSEFVFLPDWYTNKMLSDNEKMEDSSRT